MQKEVMEIFKKNFNETNKDGLGEVFDSKNLIEVDVSATYLLNLYKEVTVYADEEKYYFLKDDILVYIGKIDKEGSINTIEKDIISTSAMINLIIALSLGDEEKLTELTSEPENCIRILAQMAIALNEAERNRSR